MSGHSLVSLVITSASLTAEDIESALGMEADAKFNVGDDLSGRSSKERRAEAATYTLRLDQGEPETFDDKIQRIVRWLRQHPGLREIRSRCTCELIADWTVSHQQDHLTLDLEVLSVLSQLGCELLVTTWAEDGE